MNPESAQRQADRAHALTMLFNEGTLDHSQYIFTIRQGVVLVYRKSNKLLLIIDGNKKVVRYRQDSVFVDLIKDLARTVGFKSVPMNPDRFSSSVFNMLDRFIRCDRSFDMDDLIPGFSHGRTT